MNAAMVSANTGSVNNTAQLNHRNSLSTPQAQPHTQAINSAQTTNSIQVSNPRSAPTIAVDIQSGNIQSGSVKNSSLKSSSFQTTVSSTAAFKVPIDLKPTISTDTQHNSTSSLTASNETKSQKIIVADTFNSYSLKSGPLNLTGVLNRSPTPIQATDTVAGTFVSTDTPAATSHGGAVNAQQPVVNMFTQPSDTSAAAINSTDQNSTVDDPSVNAESQTSNRQAETAAQQVEQQVKDKQQQIEQAEIKQIDQLAQRDTEVKTHEQAHAAVGGSLAQSPSYQYEKGPDGRRYAVDGEVNIDVSTVDGDAQATLSKMQKVYAAAMAPVQPSMADIRVAAQALQNMNEAKKELITSNSDALSSTTTNTSISQNSQTLTNDPLNADDSNMSLLSPNRSLSAEQRHSTMANDTAAVDDSTSQSLPSPERYSQQHQSIEIYV
ncbi:putative metalloprotease CJM1_0395 family protein [Shewanella sp. S1-58-MNA-CIBAN-0166]|uniref:putative metalloprotease CJM1_0395 family protein n=1 Tax=Shewanella sp. S1-58-MNA-CIBAN-0166 TaxID=3140467 RepID=UPI00331F08D8